MEQLTKFATHCQFSVAETGLFLFCVLAPALGCLITGPNSVLPHGSGHRLISRDRPTKYCVLLKILNNFPFAFYFAALSFLPKGIGGVFVDYSGYNKKYSELVHIRSHCCLVLLINKKKLITIFTVFWLEKNWFYKKSGTCLQIN